MSPLLPTEEHQRLAEADAKAWRKWGPYLSDRAWATVREDYSGHGEAWDAFPHDHARMRAYRWGEDGIAGFCDDHQNLCMALALWNEHDPILKERFFGLTNGEGNHGEDVKELYHYLDCTPTSSYARMLYRYPQAAYPYGPLLERNRNRPGPEWELSDELAADFRAGRYFDITVEYAKSAPEDILCRITARNGGPEPAPLHLLPHLWYRNYWSWPSPGPDHPRMCKAGDGLVLTSDEHPHLEPQWWYAQDEDGTAPELLFTDNDSNAVRLGWSDHGPAFVKDGIHAYLVPAERELAERALGRQTRPEDWIHPEGLGSKVAAHFSKTLQSGESWELRLRLARIPLSDPFASFGTLFELRKAQADRFYAAIQPVELSDEERLVHRQALAGLLWSRQYYHYEVETWLRGDPATPPPPEQRRHGRNRQWRQLDAGHVILMPDAWEYPWFAAWDLAFHCLALAPVDPGFAKSQLLLLLREYYMHPSGQIPAYEWEFSDVNPPVTAWAALQIYRQERAATGVGDTVFLERAFQKLLLNFTWWVNRVDLEGDNLFQGGFLGLDNISIVDRTSLPAGKRMEQADGTAWVATFCVNMMSIALELERPPHEDLAIKFLDHFMYIARAMVNPHQIDPDLESLWDRGDRFFYDHLYLGDQRPDIPLRIRSLVGLIPLLAVETLDRSTFARRPGFKEHWDWLLQNGQELLQSVAPLDEPGSGGHHLLSLFKEDMLQDVLRVALDEARMLSPYGLRSLSKEHRRDPFTADIDGQRLTVPYAPGEADISVKGGNSNWRGPVWIPANYLLIQALRTYHDYHGDAFRVPLSQEDGTVRHLTLEQVAEELSLRVRRIFLPGADGRRPCFGSDDLFAQPEWRDTLLFHEYFHGEDGRGLGANHQTGWTALVANLIQEAGTRVQVAEAHTPVGLR